MSQMGQHHGELDSAWFDEHDHHHGDGDDGEENPFLWVMIRMLRDFARRTRGYEFGRPIDFQHATWILVQAGVPKSFLAERFSCTEFAIERWADGRSSPSPLARPYVISEGLNFLLQSGLKMAGKVYDPITGELRISQ